MQPQHYFSYKRLISRSGDINVIVRNVQHLHMQLIVPIFVMELFIGRSKV